jgi:hypothetical protein
MGYSIRPARRLVVDDRNAGRVDRDEKRFIISVVCSFSRGEDEGLGIVGLFVSGLVVWFTTVNGDEVGHMQQPLYDVAKLANTCA